MTATNTGSNATTSATFREILRAQCVLLEELARHEARLQLAVLQKDWVALESEIREMRGISDDIELRERNRNEAYAELKRGLGMSDSDSFYEVLSRLPMEDRAELAELYRNLRIGIAKVKSITLGIDAFVTATVGTMREIFEELFPEHKGRLYSRRGVAKQTDTSSMVVNHRM